MEQGFTETGLPWLRIAGRGDHQLLILPSLNDTFRGVHNSAKAYARFFRPYLECADITVLGRPHPFPQNWDFPTLAERTANDMDELFPPDRSANQEGIDVLGASMGGLLALRLAALRPGQVRKLVVETAAMHSNALEKTVETSIQKIEAGDIYGFVRLLARNTFTGWRNIYVRAALPLLRLYLAVRPPDAESLLMALKALKGLDLRAYGREIAAETLVIGGDRDVFFPPETLMETDALIPESQLVLLEGTGHGAPLERKREMDSTVLDFLQN